MTGRVYAFRVTASSDSGQLGRVRERFTRTAEEFARFSLATRAEEAAFLVRLVAPQGTERALDLACGPGTFARALAPRVRFLLALDLTPALLAEARGAVARAQLANVAFLCSNALALPLPDASLDLAICGYSVHHFADPVQALAELVRVTQRGGRIGLMDLVAPEEPERATANNHIERTRDASHVTTLRPSDFRAMAESAGLRVLEAHFAERPRSFDDWMQIAGWHPGDPSYTETRRLMEASIAGDTAGFHPRRVTQAEPSSVAAAGDIEFVQTSFCLAAEKP